MVERRVALVGVAVGLAIVVISAGVASQGLAPGEAGLFRAVNSLPDFLKGVLWPFMQFGVFITIPLLSVIALALRRFRLAAAMALAGVGVYLLAKVLKGVVDRGRPAALVADVHEREVFGAGSLGYPSGHAAVSAALAVIALPYLRGRWKLVPIALAVVVCIGRMYVAAHTALDLVGGAALGVAAGCAANLFLGVPAPRSQPETVAARP